MDDEYLHLLHINFARYGQRRAFMTLLRRYKLSSNIINIRYQGTACLNPAAVPIFPIEKYMEYL